MTGRIRPCRGRQLLERWIGSGMSDSRHRSRVAKQPKQARPIPWEIRSNGDGDDIDALADVFAWFGSVPLPYGP